MGIIGILPNLSTPRPKFFKGISQVTIAHAEAVITITFPPAPTRFALRLDAYNPPVITIDPIL